MADKKAKPWEPHLIGNYEWDEVASSLQKMIRRGQEYEACFWGYVFHQSSFGVNFILVSKDNSYGTWEILEVTGSPLVPNIPHYSTAVELDVIRRIAKLGNCRDIWQHEVRGIGDFNKEMVNIIKLSLEYLKNPPAKQYVDIPSGNDW